MDSIGNAVTRVLDKAAAPEASHQSRLHALALLAARDRDGIPVSFDRDVDHNIARAVLTAWTPSSGMRPLKQHLTASEHAAVQARAAALELALARQMLEALALVPVSAARAWARALCGAVRRLPRWLAAVRQACSVLARARAA